MICFVDIFSCWAPLYWQFTHRFESDFLDFLIWREEKKLKCWNHIWLPIKLFTHRQPRFLMNPLTIMQRASNVMMIANWSCLYSDCSPSLSWWILRIGLLITDIKFVSIHPSIMWEYRARTWSSHQSSIVDYKIEHAFLCFFWINSSQNRWLDSCVV